MKRTISKLSSTGNRRQAAVVDAINYGVGFRVSRGLRHGIITDVYTVDNDSKLGMPYGRYTLYSVRIAPLGKVIRNVPAVSSVGHYPVNITAAWNEGLPNYAVKNSVELPYDDIQNIEETPYVINQPVLIGFIHDRECNPIILGPLPCTYGGFGQTSAEYPKKYGSFQGTSWSIDKEGSVNLDLPSTQKITIRIDGKILCYITDGVVDLGANDPTDGTAGTEKTILGEAFERYMQNLISTLNNHTHDAGLLVAPSGGGSVTGTSGGATLSPFTEPVGIYTSVVKVK